MIGTQCPARLVCARWGSNPGPPAFPTRMLTTELSPCDKRDRFGWWNSHQISRKPNTGHKEQIVHTLTGQSPGANIRSRRGWWQSTASVEFIGLIRACALRLLNNPCHGEQPGGPRETGRESFLLTCAEIRSVELKSEREQVINHALCLQRPWGTWGLVPWRYWRGEVWLLGSSS